MASYSDNFNRADLGSDWVPLEGAGYWEIYSSAELYRYTVGEDHGLIRYNVALDGSDHFAQVDMTYTGRATAYNGPAVRVHASNDSCYFYGLRSSRTLFRKVAGVDTALTSGYGAMAMGNTYKLEAEGDFFRGSTNGTQDFEYEDVNASSYLANYTGIVGSTDRARCDNFLAEDLAPAYNVTLSSPTATVTSSTTATVGCTVTYT